MKTQTLIRFGVVVMITAFGSVVVPALTSAVQAGWFNLVNPVPTISTVNPSGVKVGSPSFTLTVNGTNFVSDSVVRWNSADRSTTYVNATRLTIQVPASDITATGTITIAVFNPAPGGAESNNVPFQINSKTNTTTTILSHLPNPSAQGASVTVTYAVTATSGTPTGTVTVSDGVSSCSASVAAGSCALTLTTVGTRILTATYSGDSSFNDSAASVSHVVLGPQYFPFIGKAPTPTPTNTPTPTPTPIPNPVQNPGFEQGHVVWDESVNGQPSPLLINDTDLLAPVKAHSGHWYAWLGGFDGAQTLLSQQVTIPAGGSTLRFYHWIDSSEGACGGYDAAAVVVGGVQKFWTDLCVSKNTSGWVRIDVSLIEFVGQTVWLQFYAQNDNVLNSNSNWYIDDVQLGTLVGGQFVPYRR